MTGIHDLAKHLSISIGTVSRALNDKPDVSPKTRQLVLDAAKELGYVPNLAGRSLRQGSSNVVGFMLSADSESMMLGDMFFVRIFDGMQSVLSKYNLDLVALLVPSSEDPRQYLRRTVSRQFYDAIILSSTRRHDERIEFLAEKNIPFVTLGRSLTEGGQPWLDLDFEGVVETSVARLASKGHRDIAIALPKGELNLSYVVQEYFEKSLAKHGLDNRPDLVFSTPSGDAGGYDLALKIRHMKQPATAVITTDHVVPFGLYRGLAELGLTPGKDLAIMGIGTRLSSMLVPTLTHFRFNLFDLGQQLAQALIETLPGINNGETEVPVGKTVPFTLVEGESD